MNEGREKGREGQEGKGKEGKEKGGRRGGEEGGAWEGGREGGREGAKKHVLLATLVLVFQHGYIVARPLRLSDMMIIII